jgi:alkanesulfonate monooxygenase SsuD/methylene tetrahydromethanopterin reductase-like flavin-dependent oxidoreductase (luciferase family)
VRHGLFLPPVGELSHPLALVDLAVSAEEHGWDGLFLWDHVLRPPGDPAEVSDPWVVLGAVAARTARLRLGTMVTPLTRRRPQIVARATTTLDHLSNGRLVLGVGLGVNTGGELEKFGEETDERLRAARLDEAIDVLLELWSGREVDHSGDHFTVSHARFLPVPVQRPRIPVWAAARGTLRRPAPLRRAARLDGLFPVDTSLEQLARMVATVRALRGSLDGFDVAATVRPGAPSEDVAALESAGATWAMWSFGVHATRDEVARAASRHPTPAG